MTQTNTFASKLTVAFVAIAMMLSAIAPLAQAQTAEELQAQIAELMATINTLQSQVGQGATSVASGICPYSWTRSLSSGSTGDDVMKLQMFLNADEETRVAMSGAGSVGAETMYYGPATAAAVSKFQVKYRADILSPGGLVNPTGYFGPASIAKANMLCSSASTPVDPGEEEGEEAEEEESMELSGEGELDVFEVDDASDTDIQEGAEDEVIAEITVEAAEGDIEVDRMTFKIADSDSADNSEEDPWDVFDEITLWVDGEEVASFDASDEDAYLDEDEGEFRFSGLGLVLQEDEEVEILVGATVASNVDDAGDSTKAGWKLTATEVRYFDADDVAENDSTTDELPTGSATFEIVEEGDGEGLKFATGSSNPDATDIVVDTDSKTDGVTVLEYTIEAEDADVELNTLFVKITTSTTSAQAIDEVTIDIDGEEFDAENSASSTVTSTTFEFDIDGDVMIDEDEEVTVKVMVDFRAQEISNNQPRYANGTTIEADVTSVEAKLTDAEGSTDILAADISGTANGEQHTLVAEGIVIPIDSVVTEADASGDNDTTGQFSITFDVTAVEGTFYVNNLATTTAGDATALLGGVQFAIQSDAGVATTVSATLSSDGDVATNGAFTIDDGETEEFTLDVTFAATTSGLFRVVLQEVWYSVDDDGENALPYVPTPASDFDTAYQQVNSI